MYACTFTFITKEVIASHDQEVWNNYILRVVQSNNTTPLNTTCMLSVKSEIELNLMIISSKHSSISLFVFCQLPYL